MKADNQQRVLALCMIAPACFGLLLFVLIPFLLAVLMAFTNLRLGSPLPLVWVGFSQFERLLADSAFLHAIANNCLFALGVVPAQTILALLLALLLQRNIPGRVVLRTLFFMPVVFPLSLVAVLWVLIYAPGPNGMLNGLLSWISLGVWVPRDFLHDPNWALPAIMLTSVWQGVGFQMVILLAGLQSIPNSLYEAAAVDGASAWQSFWYITLPRLRNSLIFVVLVTSLLAFRLFDQVQIMTQGGPRNATTTLMYEAVSAAFGQQQIAKGAAISVVFFLIVLTLSLLQRRVLRQESGII